MLTIILPTYNEKKNLAELSDRIKTSSPSCEIIVVDDNSPDKTAEFANNLGLTTIVRPHKMGLASAILDGFKLAKGDVICVMDADLSHPPEVIPQMYNIIKNGDADIVIGSRLCRGGGQRDWTIIKRFISDIARFPARLLTNVKDSTSGFFMLKKSVVQGIPLNSLGYKLLLEILVKGNYNNLKEIPIIFANRSDTKSKLGLREITEYYTQIGLLYKDLIWGKLKKRGNK
ncbi:polyprenol monophosphomannose synthase [Candidatus Saganbacteria bacterium]|nr:polyprenol monophosphomannose synthase [Candidatus Saganbacteria bacterium]